MELTTSLKELLASAREGGQIWHVAGADNSKLSTSPIIEAREIVELVHQVIICQVFC